MREKDHANFLKVNARSGKSFRAQKRYFGFFLPLQLDRNLIILYLPFAPKKHTVKSVSYCAI
jgi:hypothetical protein